MMSSEEKLQEIKDKLSRWATKKEQDVIRKVALLKRISSRSPTGMTKLKTNVYTDVVAELDRIKGL